MKKQDCKTTAAIAPILIAAFIYSCLICNKEVANFVNQRQLKASILQANAARTFLSNDKVLFDTTFFAPCANGGTGEDIKLSGYLHVLINTTINSNIVRAKVHYQPQGIVGIGKITRDKYRGTGVTQDEFKGSLVNGQYEKTFVNNFRIIGPGKGNNILFHEVLHITVSVNGAVTVLLDHLTEDCR
jgi:hypothetical protein